MENSQKDIEEIKMQNEKLQKQYQLLIDARNFHYDNLNKWMITFYAIIGALFLALHTLHADVNSHRYMELCVAVVGYVVSLGAILSLKGYYYWETNWIMLIHHFEKVYFANEPKDMRVYSVFANQKANSDIGDLRQGANISTSKVALSITSFISWLWGFIVVYFCISIIDVSIHNNLLCCKVLYSGIVSLALTYILVLVGGQLFLGDLGNIDDLELTKDNINKPLKEKNNKNENE